MGLRKLGFKLDDKLRRMHPMKREQLHDELLRPRTEVDQVKIGDKWYSRTKVYKTLEKIAQEKTADLIIGRKVPGAQLVSGGLFIGTDTDHKAKSEIISDLFARKGGLRAAREAYQAKYPKDYTTMAFKFKAPPKKPLLSGREQYRKDLVDYESRVKKPSVFIHVGRAGSPEQTDFYQSVIGGKMDPKYTRHIGKPKGSQEKTAEKVTKKDMHEAAAKWHAGTFNINSARAGRPYRVQVAGKPGARELNVVKTKQRLFRSPETAILRTYRLDSPETPKGNWRLTNLATGEVGETIRY